MTDNENEPQEAPDFDDIDREHYVEGAGDA